MKESDFKTLMETAVRNPNFSFSFTYYEGKPTAFQTTNQLSRSEGGISDGLSRKITLMGRNLKIKGGKNQ